MAVQVRSRSSDNAKFDGHREVPIGVLSVCPTTRILPGSFCSVAASRAATGLSEQQVQAHVKANLARFKVPREVSFLKELPRNATGKVLKRELSALGEATPIS